MPLKKNQQNYWSFYPSEPFTIAHFNVRHPVEEEGRVLFKKLLFSWAKYWLNLTIQNLKGIYLDLSWSIFPQTNPILLFSQLNWFFQVCLSAVFQFQSLKILKWKESFLYYLLFNRQWRKNKRVRHAKLIAM